MLLKGCWLRRLCDRPLSHRLDLQHHRFLHPDKVDLLLKPIIVWIGNLEIEIPKQPCHNKTHLMVCEAVYGRTVPYVSREETEMVLKKALDIRLEPKQMTK